MKRFLLIVLVVALVFWGRSAVYAVDQAEFVYVTRFGEPITIHNGETAAGLKVKAPWPIDSVLRIDRRVQSFDLPAVESLTRDPVNRTVDKTLAVDAFVTWKIPDATAADRFVKVVRTPEQARKILAPLINGRLAALISTMPLDDLISVAELEAIDARTDRVRRKLLGDGEDNLTDRALGEYGIQILDIRVRRFSYPQAVRDEIAKRIRSERERKVAEYESDGRRRADAIRTDAFATARETEDKAAERKKAIESMAKAEAAKIVGAAHAQDPAFATFLEKLQAFQGMVAETRDVLLLSTKHPLFDLLRGPPPK
jgi:membrane protease subunit HflC